MRLLHNIIYSVLSLQEKFLRFRLSRTINVKNKSKRKRHYGEGFLLDLNSMADAEKECLEAEITNILKTYEYNPVRLLEYIKNQGTPVHIIKDSKKILNSIGENEGFILPACGAKALYLSLGVEKTFKLKTSEMFVLSEGEINKYYFIYHFYNWYAYKHGIEGLDRDSQELLRKFLFSDSDTKELQMAEIFQLKDAIKADKASIEFVIKLCRNYDGAKNAFDKLTDGGAKL